MDQRYEEKVLPIKIGAPAQEGSWSQARNGTYPFTLPVEYAVQPVQGKATLKDKDLAVGKVRVAMPEAFRRSRDGPWRCVCTTFLLTRSVWPCPLWVTGFSGGTTST